MYTFEGASKRLDDILQLLSDEGVTLEDSLKLYSEAAELISFCNNFLNNAQLKIQEIDKKLIQEVENA